PLVPGAEQPGHWITPLRQAHAGEATEPRVPNDPPVLVRDGVGEEHHVTAVRHHLRYLLADDEVGVRLRVRQAVHMQRVYRVERDKRPIDLHLAYDPSPSSAVLDLGDLPGRGELELILAATRHDDGHRVRGQVDEVGHLVSFSGWWWLVVPGFLNLGFRCRAAGWWPSASNQPPDHPAVPPP